jgi:hypothetical protein
LFKDGNETVLGWISTFLGQFRFGLYFSSTVFGFGAPKLIKFDFEFGFSPWIPMDNQNKSSRIKIHVL